MTKTLSRLADRALSRFVPVTQATAACSYEAVLCYCVNSRAYLKQCMLGCPGVPDHCYPCRQYEVRC